MAKAGGEIRAPAREFPQIGSQAIVTTGKGAPVGLLQSSTGVVAEMEPAPGEWNWFHLFVKNPRATADFYRQVFNYEVTPDSRMGKSTELLLSSGATNRGGVSVLPDREGAKPGWLGIIRVANLDETLARVPALDGEVIVRRTTLPSAAVLLSFPIPPAALSAWWSTSTAPPRQSPMKNLKIILLGALILAGLEFELTGCVAEVAGRRGGGPWYHEGPWMDGGHWGGGPRGTVNIEVHPPGFRH